MFNKKGRKPEMTLADLEVKDSFNLLHAQYVELVKEIHNMWIQKNIVEMFPDNAEAQAELEESRKDVARIAAEYDDLNERTKRYIKDHAAEMTMKNFNERISSKQILEITVRKMLHL